MSAAKKTTKADYLRLIGEVDMLLATVHYQLTDARTSLEARKHKEQLDMLLDERLSIMKLRDSCP